jgi:hypothetical protein
MVYATGTSVLVNSINIIGKHIMKKLILIAALATTVIAHADPAELVRCGNEAYCQAGNNCAMEASSYPIPMVLDHISKSSGDAYTGKYDLKSATIESGVYKCTFVPQEKSTNTIEMVFRLAQPAEYTLAYPSYWSGGMCTYNSATCQVTINN